MKKSTLADFDQFITLENKWKAKLKDIHGSKKPPKRLSIERTIARIRECPFNEGFKLSMAPLGVGPLGDL